MSNILTIDDFDGQFEMPSNSYTDSQIELYIANVQEDYLTDLLGHDLYNEFMTALAGTPDAKWTKLRDGDTYEDGEYLRKFKGIKEMLKYFTYFEYMRSLKIEARETGLRMPDGTNSEEAGVYGTMRLKRMYNKGIAIYQDAYFYIKEENKGVEIFELFRYKHKYKTSLA